MDGPTDKRTLGSGAVGTAVPIAQVAKCPVNYRVSIHLRISKIVGGFWLQVQLGPRCQKPKCSILTIPSRPLDLTVTWSRQSSHYQNHQLLQSTRQNGKTSLFKTPTYKNIWWLIIITKIFVTLIIDTGYVLKLWMEKSRYYNVFFYIHISQCKSARER